MTEQTETDQQSSEQTEDKVIIASGDQAEMLVFLNRLQEHATEVCEEAVAELGENESFTHQAVNWASLVCNDAECYLNSSGQRGFRVTISEASPDAGIFRQYVADALTTRGYSDIEVITEW